MTFDELIALNTKLLERHKRCRVFAMFGDGTLEHPARRETFFACLQVFARTFQTILFARQAACVDERYGALFRRHLDEEIGHDDILRKDRGKADEIWDPILEGACAWFVSRMTVLDNIEKLALVNLVLESSGAYMGAVSKDPMRAHAYFGLHDELDNSHVTIALEPLKGESGKTLARVAVVVEQAWRMLDTFADRVAELVDG